MHIGGVAARAAMSIGLMLFVAVSELSHAQRATQSESRERTRATPTISASVFEGLAIAQRCMDEDDGVCARERLDRLLATRGLSGYEAAQVWMVYGALHAAEERYGDSIAAFENVLQQEDLSPAMEQSALYALAQLHGQEQQYERALAALERWFGLAESPSAEAWSMKARFHYLLEHYAEAIEPARAAILLAEEHDKPADEALHQVLQYAYLELDDPEAGIEVGRRIIELWPKKQHLVTLAALYGQIGEELVQLALYEAAFEAGWVTSGAELSSYAQLLLLADIPHKAARVLEQGLDEGVIESTETSWRMLAQAWQLALDDERALPALRRASELAGDGEVDIRLASAYATLFRWQECLEAAERALERGIRRPDEAQVQRGICLTELKRFAEAREAFQIAAKEPRSRPMATSWLTFVEAEERYGIRMTEMIEERRALEARESVATDVELDP